MRAVAAGLTRSGSVDGYVWEALTRAEPTFTENTRVIAKSELPGFPPVACRLERAGTDALRALPAALVDMPNSPTGRTALGLLQLDGFTPGGPALFDGIAARMRQLIARG